MKIMKGTKEKGGLGGAECRMQQGIEQQNVELKNFECRRGDLVNGE